MDKHQRIDEYLSNNRDAVQPLGLAGPVRDLSPTDLMYGFVWLLARGVFEPADKYGLFNVDAGGNVTSRLVTTNAQGATAMANPRVKVTLKGPQFNGMDLLYVAQNTPTGMITAKQIPQGVDPRNIIFLWKLTNVLKDQFQATTLYHNGFAFGADRTDCHGQGRAVDFAGVSGDGFQVTVYHNWRPQPVVLVGPWRDPKTGRQSAAGDRLADWPPNPFNNTNYRLDPTTNRYLKPELNPDLSRRVFQAVYDLAAAEITDTGTNTDAPTTIGRTSKFTLHPDHPTSAPGTPHGREAHNNHMHMQIGPTGTEA